LYDYGPTGCAVKSNITAFWRKARALASHLLPLR
jgi:glycyl-tRNA synthetase (class II)